MKPPSGRQERSYRWSRRRSCSACVPIQNQPISSSSRSPRARYPRLTRDRVNEVAIENLLEVEARMPSVLRNSRYAFRASSLISGGSSRYAAQKRGVARDLTACRGRVPWLCRLSAHPGLRRRAWPERPVRLRTGRPVFVVPKLIEQPLRDPVLFVGRERCEFRNGDVQRAGHHLQWPTTLSPTTARPTSTAIERLPAPARRVSSSSM
jgi:hypothetical protein